jgi:hypothetical protein
MQLEGKAGLSILEACDAARISRAGFTGTLMSTCRGKQIRNCVSRSNKSVLITVATVLGGS